MTCWCRNIDGLPGYRCFDCEKDEKWRGLNTQEKIKLLAYKKIIDNQGLNPSLRSHQELAKFVLSRDLDISIVPV
jgi:hypothetical protein